MEDHQPQSTADEVHTPTEFEASVAMTEQLMWLAAVRGKNKDLVFGLGSEAYFSSRTYTAPSPPPPLNPAVEDRIGCLEELMPNMMVPEMQASSSTTGPSQLIASSTSPAPNDDEMGVLD
ncbi:UNVERIFIED_CONTAM: hypothetical protein Sangu_0386300 [Sesamum angustifolium]|uniref:Uncharacterized protein n=1 Tax=Sesamum angustifolium TaxID=2727405 RepID=A0AAW2QSU7_9LAMI